MHVHALPVLHIALPLPAEARAVCVLERPHARPLPRAPPAAVTIHPSKPGRRGPAPPRELTLPVREPRPPLAHVRLVPEAPASPLSTGGGTRLVRSVRTSRA